MIPLKWPTKLPLQGIVAAATCAFCFALGIVTMKWIAPDIYVFPEGRLRVIEQYGWLLHLWHFIVFPLVGLCVLVVNRTLIKQSPQSLGGFATLCTLACCVALSHDIAIFTIESLANEFFINQHFNSHHEQTQLTMSIYKMLIKLRASTEWGIDLWMCLISVYMLMQKRLNPFIPLVGFGIGTMGIAMLLIPSLYPVEYVYLTGMMLWFASLAVALAMDYRAVQVQH